MIFDIDNLDVLAAWAAGILICSVVYWPLQLSLEKRIAPNFDSTPVAKLRKYCWNLGLVAMFQSAAFYLIGTHAILLTLIMLGALYMLDVKLSALLGRVLAPGDIGSVREAITFLPNFIVLQHLAVLLAIGIAVVAGGLVIAGRINSWLGFGTSFDSLHIGLLVGSFLLLLGARKKAESWPTSGDAMAVSTTDQNQNVHRLGFVLQAWLVIFRISRPIKPPQLNRLAAEMGALARTAESTQPDPSARPDIVFVMMESLADLTELGVPLIVDPLAVLKSAVKHHSTGKLKVNVIGGNTCDTEFEILTGISLARAGSLPLPYMSRINNDIYSLPRRLKRLGYTSTAIHPFHRWFYNRDRVYRKLGFNQFIADESFVGANQRFGLVSDDAFVDAILSNVDHDDPRFIFGVSVMGHGPYAGNSETTPRFVAPDFFKGQPLQGAIEKYCTIMAETSRALCRLQNDLASSGRPYVLVAFGDHIPVFAADKDGVAVWNRILRASNEVLPPSEKLYRTPIFLFSNVTEVTASELGEIDASDLSAEILSRLGLVDELAFGTLRASRITGEQQAAYAFDTIYGDQMLSQRYIEKVDQSQFDGSNKTYKTYNLQRQEIKKLAIALKERQFEAFDVVYKAIEARGQPGAEALYLWATKQIDCGNTDETTEAALGAVIAGPNPFWGCYQRIKIYSTRKDYAAITRDATTAIIAAPEECGALVGLARAFSEKHDAEGALSVLSPIIASGSTNPAANLLWASLRIDAGYADDAIALALDLSVTAAQPFWTYFHRIRLFAKRGDCDGVGDAAETLAAILSASPATGAEWLSALTGLIRTLYFSVELDRAVLIALLDPLVSIAVLPDDVAVIWASLQLDAGIANDQVLGVLSRATESLEPFWAHYHRVRLYGMRHAQAVEHLSEDASHTATLLSDGPQHLKALAASFAAQKNFVAESAILAAVKQVEASDTSAEGKETSLHNNEGQGATLTEANMNEELSASQATETIKSIASPNRLLRLLSLPGTDTPPVFQIETMVGGEPCSGWLRDSTGRVRARLSQFRFDFLHFDADAEQARADTAGKPQALAPAQGLEPIDLHGARISTTGDWFWIGNWLFGHHGNEAEGLLRFESDAPRIVLVLHAHGWSGIAHILIDDAPPIEFDLYNQEAGIPKRFEIANPGRQLRRIVLAPTGRSHPQSQGRQLLIENLYEETGPLALPTWKKTAPVNRGGAFPESAMTLLQSVAANGVFLDIGGGRRQIDDVRYLNLEYTLHDEPDLLGDGLALPFRDESIDAIYSSAVLEHVRDPLRFAAEIWRVLKPGGKILVNGAFMQPIHSEGQHFFNVTNYALEMMFDRFVDRQVWWRGSLNNTVRWMLRVAGVTAQADAAEMQAFLASLERFSSMVRYDRLMYVAGDFWLEGRKP